MPANLPETINVSEFDNDFEQLLIVAYDEQYKTFNYPTQVYISRMIVEWRDTLVKSKFRSRSAELIALEKIIRNAIDFKQALRGFKIRSTHDYAHKRLYSFPVSEIQFDKILAVAWNIFRPLWYKERSVKGWFATYAWKGQTIPHAIYFVISDDPNHIEDYRRGIPTYDFVQLNTWTEDFGSPTENLMDELNSRIIQFNEWWNTETVDEDGDGYFINRAEADMYVEWDIHIGIQFFHENAPRPLFQYEDND